MRDILCDNNYLQKKIIFNESQILQKEDKIASLEIDIKNAIQRHPKKNEDIIFDTKARVFQLLHELIRAEYSLGTDCTELEKHLQCGFRIIRKDIISWFMLNE